MLPEFPKIFGKSYSLNLFDAGDDFHSPTLSMLESTQICKEPPEEVFRGITWCRAKVTWQDVLDLVSVPIQTDATMLKRNMKSSVYDILQYEYLRMFDYSFREAGVREQDILPIIDALKKLQQKHRHVCQPVGAFTSGEMTQLMTSVYVISQQLFWWMYHG